MEEGTKETIDYAVKKLDSFFGKVVAEGGELTNDLVAYALLEIHINFAVACLTSLSGLCGLLFIYMWREWLADKLDDGIIIVAIISAAFAIGGFIGVLVNGYDMYMASKFPLMWVISNKVM